MPTTFNTAFLTYDGQPLGRRSVSTSCGQISADMEGPEIIYHTRLPVASCDAADMIDESVQASDRHATRSIDGARNGSHR